MASASWSAGNLSRDAEVREEMHQTRVDEAQRVFIKLFRKSQFTHESVNLFFICVIIKDKLTDLYRN